MSLFSKLFGRGKKPITSDELAAAMKSDEFVFYYQPEWDLNTNRALGVEALVRWESPERGYVPPMEFIPVLEKSGLIHQFTHLLFQKTLSDLTQLHKVQPDLFVAVNLSISQLQEQDLLEVMLVL